MCGREKEKDFCCSDFRFDWKKMDMNNLSLGSCVNFNESFSGQTFTRLLSTLMAAQCALTKDYPTEKWNHLHDKMEFDFIVIGAGSAGSVVANRLSENLSWSVLLLEAGGSPTPTSEIPAAWAFNLKTEMDWNYRMEKMKNCSLGMKDGECLAPRGKSLGGSSSINAMLYVRGNPDDYNEWENLGNRGWSYKNVLKYFKRSQKLSGFNLVEDDEYEYLLIEAIRKRKKANEDYERFNISKFASKKYHSSKGLLNVRHFGHSTGFDSVKNSIFDGLEELGKSYLPDVNGKNQMGFTEPQTTTTIDGRRGNTAKTFLNPVKNRPNLLIVQKAAVRKLILDGKNAVGVEVTSGGEIKTIRAKMEVILSAGAINSPQLLMLSGIGPRKHLESMGIPVRHELDGVGENLQDHLTNFGVAISFNASKPEGNDPGDESKDYFDFLLRGRGPLSKSMNLDIIGFVNTLKNESLPDVQYHFLDFKANDTESVYKVTDVLNFNSQISEEYAKIARKSNFFLIFVTLLRPKSAGKIRLRSSNPQDPLKIIGNYLEDPRDAETLKRGIEFIIKLSETKSLRKIGASLERIPVENCSGHAFKTSAYWDCLIKHLSTNLYHPVGTCKMGPKNDSMAVVDGRLRVHGLTNLRVADASVMPVIVRGNTNAACIMIGEKVSQMIKDDWRHAQTIDDNLKN